MNSFDEYQLAAMKFDRSPNLGLGVYPALGLTGEAGEVAEKIKKYHRDNPGPLVDPTAFRSALEKELGDVLWYVACVATHFRIDLSSVAATNLVKLQDRVNRGVISGSGDNR